MWINAINHSVLVYLWLKWKETMPLDNDFPFHKSMFSSCSYLNYKVNVILKAMGYSESDVFYLNSFWSFLIH